MPATTCARASRRCTARYITARACGHDPCRFRSEPTRVRDRHLRNHHREWRVQRAVRTQDRNPASRTSGAMGLVPVRPSHRRGTCCPRSHRHDARRRSVRGSSPGCRLARRRALIRSRVPSVLESHRRPARDSRDLHQPQRETRQQHAAGHRYHGPHEPETATHSDFTHSDSQTAAIRTGRARLRATRLAALRTSKPLRPCDSFCAMTPWSGEPSE